MIYAIEKYWVHFTVILLISIAILSLWPATQLPNIPGTDKSHHFIGYAALVFPAALKKAKNFGVIIFAFLLFSGVIELIQPYVNRYGEWLDMLANAIGLLCGWLLARFIRALIKQREIKYW